MGAMTLRLDDALHDELRARARRKGKSLQELLHEICEEYLDSGLGLSKKPEEKRIEDMTHEEYQELVIRPKLTSKLQPGDQIKPDAIGNLRIMNAYHQWIG